MYIKQIIIQGFKSYKEQTVIEPFSPGTNVIVGRNGSGKSNFFAAIRFVLSDAYTQMSREERQALLHEGSGSAVTSAYVEIIFDNSDGRFHTENKEVVIRRTISLKKDEYAIDRKVVGSKNEVFNMLEMAGFSRANPYYIVPQGRVTALTNMKETDRLKLLKEIAGTESYEARRTESRKIMTETISKREKIDELLKDVKDRLDELEEEKEELRGFQSKDRERRCLEYAYYHQQQEALAEALEEIEQARKGADGSSESQRMYREGEQRIAQMDSKLHEQQQSLDMLKLERDQLEEDRRESMRAQAKLELKVKTLADTQQSRDQEKQQRDDELKAVKAEIADKEAELSKILPEFQKRKDKETKVKKAFEEAEAARDRLLKKQTRSSKYRNKAERDKWLQKEIIDLNERLGQHKAMLVDSDETIIGNRETIKDLEASLVSLREELESWGGRHSEIKGQLSKAQEKQARLSEEKRALWREEDRLKAQVEHGKREKEDAEKSLNGMVDLGTRRGLQKIAQMTKENDIPGAHGTLADLMKVPEEYRLPVEQVAGNSLFHYVVDNADTSTMLIDVLEKHKAGRVTFMPLKQLHPRNKPMPRINSSEAVPLLSTIQYDRVYEKAFQQVFGNYLLCATLEQATTISRNHRVDCITMEGDSATKRGVMKGGWIDTRPAASRLIALRSVNRLRDKFDELVTARNKIGSELERKEQEITTAVGEVRKLEWDLRKLEETFQLKQEELQALNSQLERANHDLQKATDSREKIDREMREFGETLSSHEAELNTDFKKALTPQEEEELENLTEKVQTLRKQLNDCSGRRSELDKRKQLLELHLRQNLRLREVQLTSQVFEATAASGPGGNYADTQKELKKIQKRAAQQTAAFQKAEADMEATSRQITELEAHKAEVEAEQQERSREIERQQKKLEKGLQRKALLTQQLAECAKNIRDLGVLPEEAFDKYQRMDPKKIATKLKAVNVALKKYKHVNKKAFEQYNSFTAQQEQLVKRRKDLDTSQKSIEELVNHLDQKKDEAIERTFKQVSKEFATIFERLVPAGHGRLVIQRRADRNRQQQPAEDSDEEGQRQSVENYTGVGISVSFNSKEFDEQQKIQQLSGGQKSLCALCLIFAIQATESSPMVVFDEVDANLDAQYRTAVAGLLQSTSTEAGTQFICTTFRPEIVLVADKCYGVTFTNKTSSIDCVPTESALNFVEGQQKRS